MLRLPIDVAAMGFIAAGVPEPVLDFETRRPKADANGVALFEVNAMAMADGQAEVMSIRTAGAAWLADIAHRNRQQRQTAGGGTMTDRKTVAATGAVRLLYTPVEAAGTLGISRSTLYVLLASGDIPSVRIGASRRIRSTALDAYIDSLTTSGGSQPDGTMGPSRSPGLAGDAADGIESTREEGA